MKADLIRSLTGKAKLILLHRLCADTVEAPCWAKIIAKPKLYLGGALSHRQVIRDALSAMARDLAKVGFFAIEAYHPYTYMLTSIFSEDVMRDGKLLWSLWVDCHISNWEYLNSLHNREYPPGFDLHILVYWGT